jgi:UDP-N-acetylglucosamine--N-acetylmuramyl-(pentapeptide) pyrophosphoryl-undecaprenol N-acetylglucosamine transferase
MDYPTVLEAYQSKGLEGHVSPFIHDMTEAYQRADLVVSRAGASTVSELACVGKPSILVPYPFAANNHQEINAGVLVSAGGAEMIPEKELNGDRLAEVIMDLMDDEKALKEMGERAASVAVPNAVKQIVDRLEELIKQN